MPKAQSTFLPEFIRARQAQDIEAISEERGMKVAEVTTDDSEGLKVYDPSHPDADKDGFVTYPNVNMVVEMTNMLSATRSYEANLAVINFAKQMALRAIDIGR
jgi:flagellar basal-body rod protein FlgC